MNIIFYFPLCVISEDLITIQTKINIRQGDNIHGHVHRKLLIHYLSSEEIEPNN